MTWNDDVPQIPSDAETIKHLASELARLEKVLKQVTAERDGWKRDAIDDQWLVNFWRRRCSRLEALYGVEEHPGPSMEKRQEERERMERDLIHSLAKREG